MVDVHDPSIIRPCGIPAINLTEPQREARIFLEVTLLRITAFCSRRMPTRGLTLVDLTLW